VGFDYDRLGVELATLKKSHPDKLDVEVRSEDQIPFDILVHTMDVARTAGFRDLSLLDAAAGGLRLQLGRAGGAGEGGAGDAEVEDGLQVAAAHAEEGDQRV